jgi:hypothetical protein
MNKQKKKGGKAASKGLAAAYVTYESSQNKVGRIEAGTDIIESEVLGNGNFTTIGYAINPGLDVRFPALSQEAKRFDCYEFLELSFRFVGTTVISTTVGQIGLAFDPNPHSQAPTTQARFSAYECHVASSVYRPDGITLNVPKRMLAGRRYVRYGQEGNSLFQFDPGMLVIMVRDEDSEDPIGYVEVKYRVRFTDYHLEPTTAPISHRVLQLYMGASQTMTTTVQADWQFASVSTNIGGMEYSLAAGALTLARGVYRVIGNIQVGDSVNEVLSAYVGMEVGTVNQTEVITNFAATGGPIAAIVPVEAVVSLTDTSTISIPVTLTGAAGTLIIRGGVSYSKLIVVAL